MNAIKILLTEQNGIITENETGNIAALKAIDQNGNELRSYAVGFNKFNLISKIASVVIKNEIKIVGRSGFIPDEVPEIAAELDFNTFRSIDPETFGQKTTEVNEYGQPTNSLPEPLFFDALFMKNAFNLPAKMDDFILQTIAERRAWVIQ